MRYSRFYFEYSESENFISFLTVKTFVEAGTKNPCFLLPAVLHFANQKGLNYFFSLTGKTVV